MNDDQTRYPLSWPTGWKRTAAHQRRPAMFSKRVETVGSQWKRKERLSIGDGLERLTGELARLGARRIVISSNLRLRGDGLPYAQQAKQLSDPGVAVYFTLAGAPRALACDRWDSAAENMAAIAGHIDAIRAQERYGVGTVAQAFAGYAALPPKFDPWDVLGVWRAATADEIASAFKLKSRTAHPDVAGGSHEQMTRLVSARDEALRILREVGR